MLKSSLAGNRAPEFSQIQGWLNTQPLTLEGLKGKVVLLEFWTFDCINCIRTLPHMSRLHRMYAGDRFVLIGVHSPEFDFEKDPDNVGIPVKIFRFKYPVGTENETAIGRLKGNQYGP